MEQAKVGAAALAASPPDVEKAVVAYTKALIEHPTSPDYFIQRSIAFNRAKKHELSLQDAEYAVLCGQKRGKRDKIQAAQMRRVVALYSLGRYADAQFVLDKMQPWRPKESKKDKMEHDVWSSKITRAQKDNPQQAAVPEYPNITMPDEKAMQKLLQKQLNQDGTFNYNGDSKDVEMEDAEEPSTTVTTAPKAVTATNSTPLPAPSNATQPLQKIRHEWYQNNQNVIVTIYAKGVQKDKADIEIKDDSVSVSFPHPADTSASFDLSFDPLYALIDPGSSKSQIMSTKIELTLAKAVQGQKWSNIEGTAPLTKSETKAKEEQVSRTSKPSPGPAVAPSYPTSSKSGPKNWDKLADDLTAKKPKKKAKGADKNGSDSDADDAEDDGYESDMGGDAVDGFFKKLFKSSDPDTQRAMMKSFQESNGTALSTNWADVGSRHVDEVQSKDD